MTSLLSMPQDKPSLRSVYEEQIRQAAAQEERNRPARDLHDSIKQEIFAIQTSAAAAQARFDSDPAGARRALEAVRKSARQSMVEMEAMLDQLRASPIESAGLVESIKKQCEALGYRTGAKVHFDFERLPAPEQLPPGAAQALFRIAQEGLSNIARHARATEVRVSLSAGPNHCWLDIEDNGSGFAARNGGMQTGMGLANIRSRVAELGGTVTIESEPVSGTRITATLPRAKPEKDGTQIDGERILLFVGLIIVMFLAYVLGRFYHPSMALRWLMAVPGALTVWFIVRRLKGKA